MAMNIDELLSYLLELGACDGGRYWVVRKAQSEAEHMTKYFKDRYVVMSTGRGHDFQAALDEAKAIYMGSMPDIYALFPL